jgi:hypothetical protein
MSSINLSEGERKCQLNVSHKTVVKTGRLERRKTS